METSPQEKELFKQYAQKEALQNIRHITANRLQMAMETINTPLPEALRQEAKALITEKLQVSIDDFQLESMLLVHGFAHGELLIYGISDTGARENLLDAVSLYYLNRKWPTYQNQQDIDAFLEKLRQAMLKAGSQEIDN